MSGLREGFDQIVADVPVYGDLDRAIEQADRERLHRYGVVAGLAAAAAVVAVIVGVLAVTRDGNNSQPPIGPVTTPTQTPTPAKSQSPQTWSDTPVAATTDGRGWVVPDPLKAARDAWFAVVAEHLDPKGEHFESFESGQFVWPSEGSEYDADTAAASAYSTFGEIGLMVDRGDGSLFDDGCRFLGTPTPSNGTESCSTERFAGPGGERVRISREGRRCGAYEGGGPAPATCGDYSVAVAVERRDGLIGYLIVDGRGTPDFNPFAPDAMAAAAADPRLTLPEKAFAVPSDQAVVSVLEDHFRRYKVDPQVESRYATDYPGYAGTSGRLGRLRLSVTVQPAGGTPACGRSWLIECVERRVFGADDPTTVLVSQWEEQDWADAKESVASAREIMYAGPRHTVVASASVTVEPGEETIGAELDQRLIDLVLDPRLQ